MRTCCTALLALVGSILVAETARAQGVYLQPRGPNPYLRPAVSPYLNMFRGGSTAINYYGLVQPQVQGAQAITQLEQRVLTPLGSGAGFEEGAAGQMGGGHAFFQNHGAFFMTMRPNAPGGAVGGTTYTPQPIRGR